MVLTASLMTGCGSGLFVAEDSGSGSEAVSDPEDGADAADADDESGDDAADADVDDEPGDAGREADEEGDGSEDDGAGVQVPKLTRQIDSTDGTMRLFLPETWGDLVGKMDDTGELDKTYPLKAGCYEEAAFLMAAHESKENSPIVDLTDFTETLLKAVSGNEVFSDVRRGGLRNLKLKKSGLKAIRTGFSAVFEGQTVIYRIYAVEDEGRYYQITAWSTGTNERTAEAVFDAIVETFEVIG